VAVSVFGHLTPPCPWTPITTLKKKYNTKGYYKIPNTKQPIKIIIKKKKKSLSKLW
jgi:hypothetical protein